MSNPDWYVLIHQIPSKPLYLRAKIRKRLASLGAVALKDAVYALPARKGFLPRLQDIADETRSEGGEAHLLRADFVDARASDALVERFRRKRATDYAALAKSARGWTAELKRRSGSAPLEGALRARLARAKRRLKVIRAIDFFDAPARRDAEASLAAFEGQILSGPATMPTTRHHELVDRTWVTRKGIQVDRIASAWFVRRFLDPKARLRFIDPGADEVRPDDIRFDMPEGDFTHEEDRCTFETLLLRTGVTDPALARVAEIVHEIDIKDGKYSCPETTGVRQMLAGMLMATPDDESRLDRGFAMFDDLYQSFHPGLPAPAAGGARWKKHPAKGGRT